MKRLYLLAIMAVGSSLGSVAYGQVTAYSIQDYAYTTDFSWYGTSQGAVYTDYNTGSAYGTGGIGASYSRYWSTYNGSDYFTGYEGGAALGVLTSGSAVTTYGAYTEGVGVLNGPWPLTNDRYTESVYDSGAGSDILSFTLASSAPVSLSAYMYSGGGDWNTFAYLFNVNTGVAAYIAFGGVFGSYSSTGTPFFSGILGPGNYELESGSEGAGTATPTSYSYGESYGLTDTHLSIGAATGPVPGPDSVAVAALSLAGAAIRKRRKRSSR
jgi:hypothetical protein